MASSLLVRLAAFKRDTTLRLPVKALSHLRVSVFLRLKVKKKSCSVTN